MKYRKPFKQKISEVSSVQPMRIANVVVNSWSPFQTQLCGVHGRPKDFF